MTTEKLRHGKVELELHWLREGERPTLLLLHGLAERSPEVLPEGLGAWPGSVAALDFTGHGGSTLPRGGGYSAEVLMGDVDAALRRLGGATLLGRGLGAYVALLLAGARPQAVRGAILCDGPGLAGGGPAPTTPMVALPVGGKGPPDPFALSELSRDARPPDYALTYLRQANELSGLMQPVSVCGRERPEWLAEVMNDPGARTCSLAAALVDYAASSGKEGT